MTQVVGTFDTFSQIGIREDLSEVISNIAPFDTPFMSGVKSSEASNTLHEWQTDSLAAAAQNAKVQGDEAPKDSATATVRLNNRTQISSKDARVSGTGDSVNTAGRANELDYQIVKIGRELKRDMETSLLLNNAKVTGNSTTASELAGLPTWLKTNTNRGATGADPTGDGTDAATAGTARAFVEADLQTVNRSIFDEGGNPTTLMVGSFNRQATSSFTGGSTSFQKSEDKTLHTSLDIYEGDFGKLKVLANRFQIQTDAFVLEMDMFSVAYLPGRNMLSFDLAKTGDSEARQILAEYTLEVRNEKSSGVIADLTTA